MSHYPERYRTNHVPKLHHNMRDELCDERTFNTLKSIQHEYDWHWWDGPSKNRDKSWKATTKRRHQYYVVTA